VRSLPIQHGAQLPHVRVSDLDEGARFSVLVDTDSLPFLLTTPVTVTQPVRVTIR